MRASCQLYKTLAFAMVEAPKSTGVKDGGTCSMSRVTRTSILATTHGNMLRVVSPRHNIAGTTKGYTGRQQCKCGLRATQPMNAPLHPCRTILQTHTHTQTHTHKLKQGSGLHHTSRLYGSRLACPLPQQKAFIFLGCFEDMHM